MKIKRSLIDSRFIYFFLLFLGMTNIGVACTIFCGKDARGEIWAANNEDNPFSFVNYINIFPKTEDSKYGYYTLSYFSTENGENFNTQGGMNEEGLFFDFNTIPATLIKNLHKKKSFPRGSHNILSHILGNFKTSQEVIEFFDEYWFDVGFNSAQMHVADKYGNFAIIGPSGSRLLTNERFQVSTNFDICGGGDSKSCWRFPIVEKDLESNEIGLDTFRNLCKKTSLKGKDGGHTIYSNIQNLNTGDIWFYFLSDYENPYKTTLKKLLSKGRKSLLIKDLFPSHPVTQLYDDFHSNGGDSAFERYKEVKVNEERKNEILSIFTNHFIGEKNDMEAIKFLEEYLKSNPVGYWLRAMKAIYHFQKGDKPRAESIIKEYKKEVPDTSMDVENILGLFNSEFPKASNVTVELNGYQDATHVFVKGLPVPFNFLIKKDGKWVGNYKLNDGVYNYSFLVDGENVLDSKTPVRTITSEFEPPKTLHQLFVNTSENKYLTKIRVKVPDKDDVVYIAGNQGGLTYWNSVFRLKKVSDFERKIEIQLYFPARFKFTRGNWETEAVLKDGKKGNDGGWLPLKIDMDTKEVIYQISTWKDKLNSSN